MSVPNKPDKDKPYKTKEKGVTKQMPLASLTEYEEFVKKQKRPTPEDKGEAPPEPPQDQKEPREHGSKEEEKGGEPS